MDNTWSSEQNTLATELIQGMEVARRLKADLKSPLSSLETRDLLMQKILSSYEKALLILKWKTPALLFHPDSPLSTNDNPLSLRDDLDGDLKVKPDSKKRKMMSKWMDQVRVSSDTGLEGPQDDGYSWRKYGQKDILGAKYPRSYYRCTFRNTQSCWATKQVQRSDEDPTIFDITYRGKHTCSLGNNVVLPPMSPEKQEKPHHHKTKTDIQHQQYYPSQLESPTNFGDYQDMESPFTFPPTSFGYMSQENHCLLPSTPENDSFFGSFSQTELVSPNTPESSYFRSLSFKMDEFFGINNKPGSESDITEIVSANTSATNSPILDFNFPVDPVEIDPNFPFDTPRLLS
ncbi:putative WRKY transcription factor 41 [Senna tora]|uniref:Putative WRKY transcription factor 41 n=1 Tax=Senna tora TaxID=362788 RepID=A0A834TUP2_9FABA|nr:putative WRKY transcription factor 41 [Senna tora]